MTSRQGQLHLNLFGGAGTGHHEASWRYPRTMPERTSDPYYVIQLAQTAERAKFDAIFLGDILDLRRDIRYVPPGEFEPLTLLSFIAAKTDHIGLIATASTTYSEPYNLARSFASLDRLSGGRAGWNIVTSATDREANNFGRDHHLEHRERYERSEEFLEVVTKLWDSFEDDALLIDRERGIYTDMDKVHEANHVGRFYSSRGPLNIVRPPQGYPVLVQAGSSEIGIAYAARHAEVVFTAQKNMADGQRFYRTVKEKVAEYGRVADEIVILPGFSPIVGSTEQEAKQIEQDLADLQVPEFGLHQLSTLLEVNLTGYPLDEPLPELPTSEAVNGVKSRYELVLGTARGDGLTVRQLLRRLGGGRGHFIYAGTPEQIANELQRWFEDRAADGFNIMPSYLPGGLDDFVDHVVPELQRRGLFRREYAGSTLRDHYGLPRPSNQFAARRLVS